MAIQRYFILCLVCLHVQLGAQQIANLKTPIEDVPVLTMPPLDNEALLAHELSQRAPGRAPRFASSLPVDVSPGSHGKWETSPAGFAIWRLRIQSHGARSLNLGFDRFALPEGANLFLFNPDQSRIMGPFSKADNKEYNQLWTPVIETDDLILEVQVPIHLQQDLQLHLAFVNHDFLGFSQFLSGSCNLDVICGAADGWAIVDHYRDIIQSVAVYGLGGNTFCTGFLVNNTRNDCTPYFMTASHCGVNANNAPSLVVYWNFQNSTCRQPGSPASGGPGNGQLNLFNTGATLRARFPASDVALLELSNPIPEAAEAFYAGWNLSNQAPQDTVICVHHPSTDEKRISFEFDPTYPGSWGSGNQNIPDGNHIVVADWDIGTTEGGSSGSPLFNRQKQVVGQLHGGAASCNNNSYDSYGWIFYSWTGGGTPATSLKSWLDPDNTGATELGGRWARACNFTVSPLIANQAICVPDSATFQIVVSANFEDTVTLTVLDLPFGAMATFSQNPVPPGDTVQLRISNTDLIPPGIYQLTLNGTDGINMANSELSLRVNVGIPGSPELTAPAADLVGASIAPVFSWLPQQLGTRFVFQLAGDSNFTQILGVVNDLAFNSIENQLLSPNTRYFWRVRAINFCGEGPWSEVRAFTTAVTICGSRAATGLPLIIPAQGTPTVNSALTVALPGVVAGVKVTGLNIAHTWVGDLRAVLVSPAGTVVNLFDRLGVPGTQFGCQGDNLQLSFDDAAANTPQQLEETCNPNPPAASGTFQPITPLLSLAGEPATGTWTLRVNDFVNQDGGSILAWNLEICSSLPHEARLFPAQTEFSPCSSDTVTFDLGIGTAFDTSGVHLSFSGLPAGVSYAFSSSDTASPGQIVTVSIWGFQGAGTFSVSAIGISPTQTDTATISFVVRAPPAPPTLLSPLAGATMVPRNVVLSWGGLPDVSAYRIQVATDALFTQLVASNTQITTTFALSGLDFARTYFWRVDALNQCGWSQTITPSQFTTIPDFSISAMPTSRAVCSTDSAFYTLTLGPGFLPPLTFSFTGTGPGAVQPQLTFSHNGNLVIVSVQNLLFLNRGSYQMSVAVVSTANGGTGNLNLSLQVETAPPFPLLSNPPNNSNVATFTPTLSWLATPGTDNYRLEVARDETFADPVLSLLTTQISSLVSPPLGAETYYWRVTAINECGNATTSPFRFTVVPSSLYELSGMELRIAPNPTSGPTRIEFSAPPTQEIIATLFRLDGVQIKRRILPPGITRSEIDLTGLPSGTYFLKLESGTAVMLHRIILL
jgi:subtilisin-like proprotein convertase family protein